MANTPKNKFLTFDQFELRNKRGIQQSCEVCFKKFSVFLRQHSCKRCFRAICDKCKDSKIVIYGVNFQKKIGGICSYCKSESQFIKNFIQNYALQFGKQSEIGAKWLKKLKRDNQYNEKKQQNKRQIIFSEEMFKKLWGSYNYSFREYKNQTDIYKMISQVLKQLNSRTDVRLQSIIYPIVFFLCICSVQTSTKIILELLWLQKICTNSKQNILNYLKVLNCQSSEIKILEEYIQYKYRKYMSTFGLNVFTFEISLFSFDEIIRKKNLFQLDTIFSLIIAQQKNRIIKNIKNLSEIDIIILKNINLKQLKQKWQVLRDQEKKKMNNTNRSISTTIKNFQRSNTFNQSIQREQGKNVMRRLTIINDDEQSKNIEFQVAINKLKNEQQQIQKSRLNREIPNFKKKIITFQTQNIVNKNKTIQINLLKVESQENQKLKETNIQNPILDQEISNSFQNFTPFQKSINLDQNLNLSNQKSQIDNNQTKEQIILDEGSIISPINLYVNHQKNQYLQNYIKTIQITVTQNTSVTSNESKIYRQQQNLKLNSLLSNNFDNQFSRNSNPLPQMKYLNIQNKINDKHLNQNFDDSPKQKSKSLIISEIPVNKNIQKNLIQSNNLRSTVDQIQEIDSNKDKLVHNNSISLNSRSASTGIKNEINLQLQGYKYQIKQLEQKIRLLQTDKSNFMKQKHCLESKIKEFTQKDRLNQIQIKSYKNQIENMNIKLSKLQIQNKQMYIQNQKLIAVQKQNQSFANLIKEKNNKIQVLLKQSKLLNYQLDQQKIIIQKLENEHQNPNKRITEQIKNQLKNLQYQNKELKQNNTRLLKKIEQLTINIVQQEEINMDESRQHFEQNLHKKQQCLLF